VRHGRAITPLLPKGANPVTVEGDVAWLSLMGRDGVEKARTQIDVADLAAVSAHRWRETRGGCVNAKPYAVSHTAGPLHRFLLAAPDGMEADHIDRDGLNNRRENLRLVTRAQNAQNVNRDGRALPRGVYKAAPGSRHPWIASVRLNGEDHFGGVHPTIEQASDAARALRARLFTHHVDNV